jgi:glutathione S-transferase
VASLLYFKGYPIRDVVSGGKFPNIDKWFQAMTTHSSYQVTMSDYYTHNWDLPPQLGGCTKENSGEKYRQLINGQTMDGDVSSWDTPPANNGGGMEPDSDWNWAINGDATGSTARREAVERLTWNHEAIVRFACRGAGQLGPQYGAPLSDPKATSNASVQPTVDTLLRLVAWKMLAVNSSIDDESALRISTALTLLCTSLKESDDQPMNEFRQSVVLSLIYLRDRIGVPRDMRLPAARELRGHLNSIIRHLQ